MATGSTSLAHSLRHSVKSAESSAKTDVRFELGTEYTRSYISPLENGGQASYNWQPLPLSYEHDAKAASRMTQSNRDVLFPRLHSNLEEVKAKLLPALGQLLTACKKLDLPGEGFLAPHDFDEALKATGVFLSQADQQVLLNSASRDMAGHINYEHMVQLLMGKVGTATTTTSIHGLTLGRPPLPASITWPDESQGFEVRLRLRPTSDAFTISGARMAKYARKATRLCTDEADAEKVHNLLRHYMLQDLLVEAGEAGHPDLSFRNWLAGNSIMSLTLRSAPGPIPPEVYDVLDQVVYTGLGLPMVLPQTQTLTSLGVSMRRAPK